MIDDGYIWGKRERAVEDPIDDAVVPIRFVDGRHEEYNLDAVAGADGVDGAHLSRDRVLVARAQSAVRFLERVFILNERRPILTLRNKLRAVATQRADP